MSFNIQFANLDPSVQDKFIAIARKDPEGRSAAEWFEHLVPESLQDSSYETEVFMDGGTVTQEVYVYDQGRGSGHWETVDHTIGDRDVSRIQAGANGGEYTHDNTIMEDSSLNRSRGGTDMTEPELEAAAEANAIDAELIDSGTEVLADSADVGVEVFADVTSTVVTDIMAPAVGAYIVGKNVANQFTDTKDKLAWGGLASGLGALICTTPPGQFFLACYGVYAVGKLAVNATVGTAVLIEKGLNKAGV